MKGKIFLIGLIIILLSNIVIADYYMYDNSNYMGFYNVSNVSNFCLGSICIDSWDDVNASGDITAVNTNGDYLTGGAVTGAVNLLLNETKLNATIGLLDSDTTYTHLSNFIDNIGVSSDWDELSDLPTATPASGDTTHLSLSGQIYDFVIGLDYKTLTEIVANIGNWSADKSSYYTSTIIDTLGNWSYDKSSYWNTSTDLDTVIATDEITELKIDFNTVCGEGNHLYVNGNNLACEADDDTTYTAGGGLTLTATQFNHTDTSSQASSNNAGRTYIQDIILDTYGHITSIVTATETVTDTDTQDLSYDTATDVISLVDGGSIDITEVDTDTHLSEDQVEAYILDSDNTANLDLNNYNITGVSKYKYENAGDNVYTYFNGSCIITVVNSTSFAVCP